MILVLTAGFGDGHNTAARCTAGALQTITPGETVEVCDLIAEALPRTARVLQRLYQFVIVSWPSAWRFVFGFLDHARVGPRPDAWQRKLALALGEKLAAAPPRLIVSTYPVYAGLARWLAAQGHRVPPVATIITDSISVHDLWVNPPSDLYCVADRETADVVVEKLGVPRAQVRVTGFPVSAQFTAPLPDGAMDSTRQRVLYVPSTALPQVRATLDEMRPLVAGGVEMTILMGKHAGRLEAAARAFADALPAGRVSLIGWTDRVPELLRTHDLVICKAGGAMLHEVLAARCPAVIDYVVPGQEEGNAEYLTSHRCALRSRSARETAECARRLLAEGGRLCAEYREAMRPLSLPDSAMRTASAVLTLCPPSSAI